MMLIDGMQATCHAPTVYNKQRNYVNNKLLCLLYYNILLEISFHKL
jgi:hypothetical protein